MVSVVFVCLGNICRSPMAEVVFRKKVAEANLEKHIQIDSAGTGDWHSGHAPDPRAQAALKARSMDGSHLRARLFGPDDLNQFDYVVVMDQSNFDNVTAMGNGRADVSLLLDWEASDVKEVPDPYYGGDDGFGYALDLIERASEGLLQHITQQAKLS